MLAGAWGSLRRSPRRSSSARLSGLDRAICLAMVGRWSASTKPAVISRPRACSARARMLGQRRIVAGPRLVEQRGEDQLMTDVDPPVLDPVEPPVDAGEAVDPVGARAQVCVAGVERDDLGRRREPSEANPTQGVVELGDDPLDSAREQALGQPQREPVLERVAGLVVEARAARGSAPEHGPAEAAGVEAEPGLEPAVLELGEREVEGPQRAVRFDQRGVDPQRRVVAAQLDAGPRERAVEELGLAAAAGVLDPHRELGPGLRPGQRGVEQPPGEAEQGQREQHEGAATDHAGQLRGPASLGCERGQRRDASPDRRAAPRRTRPSSPSTPCSVEAIGDRRPS